MNIYLEYVKEQATNMSYVSEMQCVWRWWRMVEKTEEEIAWVPDERKYIKIGDENE